MFNHWCHCFNLWYETSSDNWNTLERNAGWNATWTSLRMVGPGSPL